jgi:hypothetical protein
MLSLFMFLATPEIALSVCAARRVGDNAFRAYVAYAPDGTPAGGRIVLHHRGWQAVDWIAGTRKEYLQSGATQLTILPEFAGRLTRAKAAKGTGSRE